MYQNNISKTNNSSKSLLKNIIDNQDYLSKPLVSVITVVYNSVGTITDTIQSVINQTYEKIEFIVIDGGSQDGTIEILKQFDTKIDYWISEPDKGLFDAMNKGIKLSKGEIIHILNSDDYYIDNDLINKVVQGFKSYDLLACHTKVEYFNNKFKIKKSKINSYLFLDTPFLHPSLFVKKRVYDIIGCFDLRYKVAGDVDFIFRAFANNFSYSTIDSIGVLMRVGGNSDVHFLKGKKEYCESYSYNFKNPIPGFIGYFYNILIFYYMKSKKILVK